MIGGMAAAILMVMVVKLTLPRGWSLRGTALVTAYPYRGRRRQGTSLRLMAELLTIWALMKWTMEESMCHFSMTRKFSTTAGDSTSANMESLLLTRDGET